MKRLPLLFALVCLAGAQVPFKSPAPTQQPRSAGGYVPPTSGSVSTGVQYKGPSGLVTLQIPIIHDEKMNTGGVNSIFNPFATAFKMSKQYKGAQASLQITESSPTFVISAAPEGQELLIVRLEQNQKKNVRELVTDKTKAFGSQTMGIPDKFRREVTATQTPDGSTIFTPTAPLKDGEYVVTIGSSGQGPMYEFGISAGK